MTFENLRRGEWCRRARLNASWHFVESKIADRSGTYCGRQLPERDGKGRELETVYAEPTAWTERLCLSCLNREG